MTPDSIPWPRRGSLTSVAISGDDLARRRGATRPAALLRPGSRRHYADRREAGGSVGGARTGAGDSPGGQPRPPASPERRLPIDWETIGLRLSTEQPDDVGEAARVLGPMNVGRVGDQLVVTVGRAGGASGPEAARRLFGRLDEARIWCLLEQDEVDVRGPDVATAAAARHATPVAEAWDAALAELPSGWSDPVCNLQLASRDLLPPPAR